MAAMSASPHFLGRFFGTLVASFAQLVRSPSHSRRAEAGRRAARHALWLTAGTGAAIIALMYLLDAAEIQMMPKRGTPGLWWVRVLTDFGKSAYMLWTLFALMAVVLIASAASAGPARALLLGLGTRLQFLFFAVLTPVLAGEVLKWVVGRGRPFVGGEANAFNFSHFAGGEAFASFPSGHANAAVALACARAAPWAPNRPAVLGRSLVIRA